MINSSLIQATTDRTDVTTILVPANEIALSLGNDRLANRVITGAVLAARPIVSLESVAASLRKVLPEKRHRLLEVNEVALQRGGDYVRSR